MAPGGFTKSGGVQDTDLSTNGCAAGLATGHNFYLSHKQARRVNNNVVNDMNFR